MSKVLKFGGTSVGLAANMRRVAEIVTSRNATVTVLSAMSGTTDALVEVCALAQKGGDGERINNIIEGLKQKYSTCIVELLDGKRNEALELLDKALEAISDSAVWFRSDLSEKSIIAQGELVTSAIFAMYMQECGHRTTLLNAPDFVHKDPEGMVDKSLLAEKLSEISADGTFYITQGFICTGADGNPDNLGRGGSDYTAALIGAAINASQVEIWTDIDGMHNNDPRYVERTYPIRRMSFDEAAELAYFGAKILHPAAILPCKERNIPVLLKNTLAPDAEGTVITDDKENGARAFHAVAAKDGITVIRIHSARMLMAYGFLRKVFEIFERFRTPIDMITTAEVAVSLTIDSDCHLDEIVEELRELGTIEVERDNTIVCIVGDMEHSSSGVAAEILNGVASIPIKMISYGANRLSMALLIDTDYKKEFLQRLNDHLFDHA